MLNARITRPERDKRYRDWLLCERFLEGLRHQQLEVYALHGQLPKPLPEPLPPGASRLDGMDRKDLIRMWEADERKFGNRTRKSSASTVSTDTGRGNCATNDAASKLRAELVTKSE